MSMIHRPSTRAFATVAAATLAALALPAASAASAASAPASPAQAEEPGATLELTITPDNPSDDNLPTTVTLTCGPAGGDHPDPKHACERLDEVDGVFADLKWSGACLEYWDPVTITATGTWYGTSVDFADRHTNRMCASAATSQVFGF